MKRPLVLCVVFILHVIGNPIPKTELIKYENNVRPDGYNFRYETDDGTRRSETGTLVPSGNEEILEVMGKLEYSSEDGVPVTIDFTASRDGYKPHFIIGQTPEEPPPVGIPSSAIASLAGGGIG